MREVTAWWRGRGGGAVLGTHCILGMCTQNGSWVHNLDFSLTQDRENPLTSSDN